ncbi:NAD-dependent epimerase/dehydratase family protein [Nocardiopsis sp. ARC36]
MNTASNSQRRALVVGGTGIAGRALCRELVAQGWHTASLSRRTTAPRDGVEALRADLTDPGSVRAALAGLEPTHVFFTAWSRQTTEAQNITVNSAMVRNVMNAVGPSGQLRHVALVTGLKHYLGPFEAYGTGATRDTPSTRTNPAWTPRTSTTPRKTNCGRPPSATGSPGASTARTPSSATHSATP